MNFSYGKRHVITLPRFPQNLFWSGNACCTNSNCFYVCIDVAPIAAMKTCGVSRSSLVKKALARHVVVYTQQLRSRLVIQKPLQFACLNSQPTEVFPHPTLP